MCVGDGSHRIGDMKRNKRRMNPEMTRLDRGINHDALASNDCRNRRRSLCARNSQDSGIGSEQMNINRRTIQISEDMVR